MSHHRRAPRLVLAVVGAALLVALCSVAPTYADLGDCSQPVTNNPTPMVTDCVHILRTASGVAECDPECICDPSGDGEITALDALSCLQLAVGIPASTVCCGSPSTTTPDVCMETGETCNVSVDCCEGGCRHNVCCVDEFPTACTRDYDCCDDSHYCRPWGGQSYCWPRGVCVGRICP